MERYQRVCAQIDLDALENNLDAIRERIRPGTGVIAVIKTNGYGHGAVPLARVMERRQEIWGYAVATVEEAQTLRKNGLQKPILILGYTFADQYEQMVRLFVRPTIFSYEAAKGLSEKAGALGRDVAVHVKLDTGMSRIGYQITPQSADEIARIAKLPHIVIEGIFTHFAKADEKDKTFTRMQMQRYEQMIGWLRERGLKIPLHHVSNSACIVDLPQYSLDLVRAGIILYGLWPSPEVDHDSMPIRPLMSLKSHIVHVKELEDGRLISYGGTCRVEGKRRIATIPVGYGDGYPRSLSNRGYVLIRGKKAPVCGRICMDQFMVDVTDIAGAAVGDEVTLIGADGAARITVEELGDISGRFPYEFVCGLGSRIPRIYLKNGKRVLPKGD